MSQPRDGAVACAGFSSRLARSSVDFFAADFCHLAALAADVINYWRYIVESRAYDRGIRFPLDLRRQLDLSGWQAAAR